MIHFCFIVLQCFHMLSRAFLKVMMLNIPFCSSFLRASMWMLTFWEPNYGKKRHRRPNIYVVYILRVWVVGLNSSVEQRNFFTNIGWLLCKHSLASFLILPPSISMSQGIWYLQCLNSFGNDFYLCLLLVKSGFNIASAACIPLSNWCFISIVQSSPSLKKIKETLANLERRVSRTFPFHLSSEILGGVSYWSM